MKKKKHLSSVTAIKEDVIAKPQLIQTNPDRENYPNEY